jgi:molecular chaperone GrpE
VNDKMKENGNVLQEEQEIRDEVASIVEDVETAEELELRDVEQDLAAALEEIASLKDRMLRLAADSENFKKRMERERVTGLKYAGEQIFREMLPVVDNLERAIGLGSAEAADPEKTLAALLEGVQLTLKSLVSTLEKFEVKPIDSIGQPFDPNKQEALTMEPSETVPASHVLNEFEKGYYYKDRLLRPARVVVSSGKPEPQQ